jgi:DNA-binding transcriptional LysR family regulator
LKKDGAGGFCSRSDLMSELSDFQHWNKLRLFYYVAYFKNFSKAARYLKVHQSSLSKTVKELEEILGDQLFSREERGIHLTLKGKSYLELQEMFLKK